MPYIYLLVAIVFEVVGTSALKATEEFTRLLPTLVVISTYAASFYFLTLVLRSMQLGVVYSIWSGLGIVLVAVAGFLFYKEIPDWPAVLGMGLIIAGVVVINLFSKTVGH